MLDIGKDQGPDAKCYFTHTLLPQYVDDKQPPTKRKPFATILGHSFVHTLEVLATKDAHAMIQERLNDTLLDVQYAKVHMKLKDLIDGEFFNHYIKTGNIDMLSEGRAGVDNTFSLHQGILRLEVDKPTYEKAGLAGKPIASPGRKHSKFRYAIELNLRLPSMIRGRPLFNRMVYAFNNALTDTVTWLFYDVQKPQLGPNSKPTVAQQTLDVKDPAVQADAASTPLMLHSPIIRHLLPYTLNMEGVQTPVLPTTFSAGDEAEATELLEWINLAMLDSPRLRLKDTMDPFLCRYEIPDFTSCQQPTTGAISKSKKGTTSTSEDSPTTRVTDLVKLRCHGFIPANVVTTVFSIILRSLPKEDWCALKADSFDGKGYVILKNSDSAMLWEYE